MPSTTLPRQAPAPTAPQKILPVSGSRMTPTAGVPSRIRPMLTVKSLPPRTNSLVPSSGSTRKNSRPTAGMHPAAQASSAITGTPAATSASPAMMMPRRHDRPRSPARHRPCIRRERRRGGRQGLPRRPRWQSGSRASARSGSLRRRAAGFTRACLAEYAARASVAGGAAGKTQGPPLARRARVWQGLWRFRPPSCRRDRRNRAPGSRPRRDG